MTNDDSELIHDLLAESDLCANEGVIELSSLLAVAARRIKQLIEQVDRMESRKVTYTCPSCAGSLEDK